MMIPWCARFRASDSESVRWYAVCRMSIVLCCVRVCLCAREFARWDAEK
jgi:hypothetical protein